MAMASNLNSFDIAKAGWLYRQSSFLHRWKRNWFVLDRQGDLRYFESPDVPKAEDRIVVRAQVTQVKTSPNCRKADPPEGSTVGSKASFLELILKDKENILLFADSFDDMKAWQIALEEARTLPTHQPGTQVQHVTHVVGAPNYVCQPGYPVYGGGFGGFGTSTVYPGQVITHGPVGAQTAQVIHTPNGTTVVQPPAQQIVYVDDDPYRYRRRYRGGLYPAPLFFW